MRRWVRAMGGAAAAVALAIDAWAALDGRTPIDPGALLDARRRLYASTYAWTDQRQVLRVTTWDAAARSHQRTIEIFERRYGDGARKVRLGFLAPDEVKGMAVLSQERAGGAPERWLYLPRQRRARRFAGQMRDEGMLGTDLTAAELDLLRDSLGWSGAALRPTLHGAERLGDVEAYAIDVARVGGYERVRLWIGAGDLVLRQLELYGTESAAVKRIRQSEVRFVGRVPMPGRVEVENPRAGTRSLFELVEAEVDAGFSDDVFSLPLLAMPKQE